MKAALLVAAAAAVCCGCQTPDPFPRETKMMNDFNDGKVTEAEYIVVTRVAESADTVIRLRQQIRRDGIGFTPPFQHWTY